MSDDGINDLTRAIEAHRAAHPGGLAVYGHSVYDGDIRDVLQSMVFDDHEKWRLVAGPVGAVGTVLVAAAVIWLWRRR
jgi:hypothetical protein